MAGDVKIAAVGVGNGAGHFLYGGVEMVARWAATRARRADALEAGDLVARRGNCSLQLGDHFKLTYDQDRGEARAFSFVHENESSEARRSRRTSRMLRGPISPSQLAID